MSRILNFVLVGVLLFCFSNSHAQSGWSVEATPNLVFSQYNVSGYIPGGLIFNKANPSFSLGASLLHKINKKFTFRLGLHYLNNNHREIYYRDGYSKKNESIKSNVRTSYFEPRVSVKYELPLKNINNLFVELGIGFFKPTNKSLNYVINTQNTLDQSIIYHSEADSVVTNLKGITALSKTFPLNFYFSIGKTFSLTKDGHRKHLNLDVMLIYRYSGNEIRISNSIHDAYAGIYYDYNYTHSSRYIGVTFRFNYLLIKKGIINNN